MFIKSLTIQNFKCFHSTKNFTFSFPGEENELGVNIFIGDNNTGKSTVFEALDFLRNKSPRGKTADDLKNVDNQEEEMFVEVVFGGSITEVVNGFAQKNKKEPIKKYIYKKNGIENLKIKRSSKKENTLVLWDSKKDTFVNESGIDAPIKKLFEFNFIWSDTNPNDEMSFGNTTITGNLLERVITKFKETQDYQDFSEKYNEVFNEDGALRKELEAIEKETQKVFVDQFGQAEIKFHFEELNTKKFFKQTKIKVTDNGVETFIEEKGSGMQRAVALSLLQVYSEELKKHPNKNDLDKPFIFFIDEPEVCLHPQAQLKLSQALIDISNSQQIFMSTHSPFIFKNIDYSKLGLFIFKRIHSEIKMDTINEKFGLFPWSPSWGEINYIAYDMPTIEFHDELYGRLHEKYITKASDQKDADKRSGQTHFEKNFLQKQLNTSKNGL